MNAKHLIITATLYIVTSISTLTAVQQVTTAADFNRIINQSDYCVAKVFTPTCPMCKGTQIDDLARLWEKESADVSFIKVNYHSMPNLLRVAPYNIRTVPRYLFFKNGRLVKQLGPSTTTVLNNTLKSII